MQHWKLVASFNCNESIQIHAIFGNKSYVKLKVNNRNEKLEMHDRNSKNEPSNRTVPSYKFGDVLNLFILETKLDI